MWYDPVFLISVFLLTENISTAFSLWNLKTQMGFYGSLLKWASSFLACPDIMQGTAPRDKIAAVPFFPEICETTKHFIGENCPAVDLSVFLSCWWWYWPWSALIAWVISTWGSQAGQSFNHCHLSQKKYGHKSLPLSLLHSDVIRRTHLLHVSSVSVTASNVVISPVLHLWV